MKRLKKLNDINTLFLRDNDSGAMVYINGNFYYGQTHLDAIKQFLNQCNVCLPNNKYDVIDIFDDFYDNKTNNPKTKNKIEEIESNINEFATMHKISVKNEIQLEEDSIKGISLDQLVNKIKEEYPDYDIYSEVFHNKLG